MPFIILKYAGRCGSHWLNSCLRSHPRVFSPKTEQFDIKADYWRDVSKWNTRIANVFDLLEQDGVQGCMVKANKVDMPFWADLRQKLAKIQGMKVIFNSRRGYSGSVCIPSGSCQTL